MQFQQIKIRFAQLYAIFDLFSNNHYTQFKDSKKNLILTTQGNDLTFERLLKNLLVKINLYNIPATIPPLIGPTQ
jgi:hypothetical protein